MDEFSKQFAKDYHGSDREEYSIYYDPNTKEQKYYPGAELPLKTGLPPNIEEGTPEAMEYKKDQIMVYGFPYEMISDSEIEKVKKLRQETVVDDPNWARASKMLRAFMQPGAEEFKTDKEYAEWGIDFMSSFENNFTNMVIDVVKLESAPPQAMHAMYYLMETSDREGILAENFWRGAYYTVFDYANLVGLGTMGIGLIGKSAGKQLTKVGFKEALKRIVMSKPDASDFAMIAEGATYAGGFNVGQQKVKVGAGKQDEVSVGEAAGSAAIGGTIGPALSRTGQVAMEGGRRVVNKVTDALTPSAENIAARNIDQVIDDTTGVAPTENITETPTVETNEFTPAIVKPVKRRPGDSGEYVGAPKSITSQQKLGAYRKNLLKLAEAGEEGRFWYERSGNAILDLVDGNVNEADKIAQAIAITSAGSTPVLANFQFAIQAYNQHKAGKEILTGKFPKAMSARLKKFFEGEDWAGRKTNTFYNNIMAVADPSRAQGVTVDMHMLRIFGFDKKNEMPTDQQYTFVENEVNRIANKLGWTPYQVQAAMWVKQKADKAGKPVSQMKFDYSDALKRNLGQISSETKPSQTSGHFAEIFNAEMKEQADFHFRMSKALTGDDGQDLLAKEVGLLTPGSFDAPGIYEGVLSPGTQTYALMPMKYKGQPGEVDEATLELVKIYAVAKGILLKQDSVGAHRVFKGAGKVADRDAVTVDIGRRFTDDEMVQLDKLLTEEFGTTDFSPAATEYGVNIVHWMGERGKMDFTDFQDRVRKVLNILEISDIDTPSGKLEAGTAASQKVYVTNTDYDAGTGWKEAPNGENYLEGTFGGRQSVQERVRNIVTKFADRIDAVEDEIVRDYGWTKLDYNSAYRGKPKDGGVDTTIPPNNEGGE